MPKFIYRGLSEAQRIAPTLALDEAQRIAAGIVGPVDWNGAQAHFLCPGIAFHTTANSRTDCKVVCEPVVAKKYHPSPRSRAYPAFFELRWSERSAAGMEQFDIDPRPVNQATRLFRRLSRRDRRFPPPSQGYAERLMDAGKTVIHVVKRQHVLMV